MPLSYFAHLHPQLEQTTNQKKKIFYLANEGIFARKFVGPKRRSFRQVWGNTPDVGSIQFITREPIFFRDQRSAAPASFRPLKDQRRTVANSRTLFTHIMDHLVAKVVLLGDSGFVLSPCSLYFLFCFIYPTS
jgi:hypothetical protein